MNAFLLEVGKVLVFFCAVAMAAACFACLCLYAFAGKYVTAGLFGIVCAALVVILVVVLGNWS